MSQSAHDAATTYDCKFPGCTNEARSPVGRYSYCAEHQGMGAKKNPTRLTVATSASTAQRLSALTALAKKHDRLREKARKLTEQALQAKKDADDAEREFQVRAHELIGEGDGARIVA